MSHTPDEDPHDTGASRYRARLAGVLAASAVYRVLYVVAQAHTDPTFSRPLLDGKAYLAWAQAILAGGGGVEGAFYQGPLYPYLLAGVIGVVGERLGLLYLLQHALMVAAAGFLAGSVRRVAGSASALAAAALFVLYAPLTFFASRPLAESTALVLLFGALYAQGRPGERAATGAGVLAGLAALARPNLLLCAGAFIGAEILARRFRRAGWLLCGLLVVVLPVTARNRVESGHWVPIASNAGITAYHGNGPGARGIFTLPAGSTGDPTTQREESTALARAATGRDLDAVEADGYWGRRALATRLDDPAGSVRLVLLRTLLLVDAYEHGLDYPPAMDENPLRLTWRFPREGEIALVPLGLLLGLAAAGLALRGIRGSGGSALWLAVLAAAVTPGAFYVSSRYRLPAAALLAGPAGCGLVALLGMAPRAAPRARAVASGLCGVCLALSLLVPSHGLRRIERAASLSNLVGAHLAAGDTARARRTAERAVALDPEQAGARYNLGLVYEIEGETGMAERSYRDGLERNPALYPAAHRLARLLIASGRPDGALIVARRALLARPDCVPCWSDAATAWILVGDPEAARRARDDAARLGIALDAETLAAIEAGEVR